MQDNDRLLIEKSNILLVEGSDEKKLFIELLKNMDNRSFQVISFNGISRLSEILGVLKTLPNFDLITHIGIIRDAEDKLAMSAFNSVCSSLRKHQLPEPTSLMMLSSSSSLEIAIFVMPDNNSKGMLEDLCLSSLEDSPVMECIKKYFECLKYCKDMKYCSKAKMMAYLAYHQGKAPSLGVAAQQGLIDFDHPTFNQIKAFINLFGNT